MGLLNHQLLLLASIVALTAAGWRMASAAVPSGLLRIVATAPLAAAGAVVSALGLALVGLGASAVALTAVALVMWALTRAAVSGRPPSAREQLGAWWSRQPLAGRVIRLAVAGAAVGYGTWVLRYPGLGYDALTYHLALPVAWIHNGRPGSLVRIWDGLPLQNYPLTWEVIVSWATAISRTLVPATLLTPAALLLLGVSIRAGLGALGVSERIGWLAAATVATLPILVVQLPGPNNDLPELAWLACAGALVAGAVRTGGRRGGDAALLVPALVAAGLCVGIKTTGAPLAVLALAFGVWRRRRVLRGLILPLVLAAAAAAVIGGVWYVRNLADHGSPFWPLSNTPWGDPIPPAFRALDASLLANLRPTLHGRLDDYWRALAGGVVVFVAALLAPLWAWRRAVAWGALLGLGSLGLWAASPYTGVSSNTALAVGATRYLLPCLLVAGVTVALAGRGGWRVEAAAALALIAALAVNLDRDAALAFPDAPSARLLVGAAAIGVAVALAIDGLGRVLAPSAAASRLGHRAPTPASRLARRAATAGVAIAVAAAAVVALLAPVDGYLAGHARTGQFDAGVVRWLDSRAAFRHGREPVLVGPIAIAVLAGARLAHPLIVIGGDDDCAALARAARAAWVVMELGSGDLGYDRRWIACLAPSRPSFADGSFLVYAPPALAAPAA